MLKPGVLTNLEKKIRKLSFEQLVANYKSKSIAQDICATIDPEDFFALRKKHKGTQPLMDFKYFNMEPYVRMNVIRALKLGIFHRRAISILDIGTGFGYFPYVCSCLRKHTVKAIDKPGQTLYDGVTDFLGIDKRHYTIKRFERIEIFDQKFDYITGYLASFHRVSAHDVWGAKEWDFFLADIRENHLTDTGVLFLQLNWVSRTHGWFMPGVREVFKAHGARFKANEATIRK